MYFTGERILSTEEKIAVQGNKKTGEAPTVKSDQLQPTSKSPAAENASPALLDPETSQPLFRPDDRPPNPFLPYKNPATGRWRGPTISLRRQAELFKIARQYDVEPLLPPSRKSSAFKQERLLKRGAHGASVRGTGEGEKVKGHKWERTMGTTLQKRIEAMERMPDLIREWRARGNGKNWKKFPK